MKALAVSLVIGQWGCAYGSDNGRGCGSQHAFIDLGANDGQSLLRFQRDWLTRTKVPFTSIHAFEMNSLFVPSLEAVLRPMKGRLILGAAWTADGTTTASMQQPGARTAIKNGVMYNMTASSLRVDGVPLNKRRRTPLHTSSHERIVSVRTYDFARWLSSHFCRADIVEVKMDIEGAEFEVLEHVLQTGIARLIDLLAVEWHTSKRADKGIAREALKRRQGSILHRLAQSGVKVVEWKM